MAQSVFQQCLHMPVLQAIGTANARSWFEDSSDEESKGLTL
ncbi:hypothetical protein ACVBJC_01080 [Shewanella sp. 0m-6]